MKNIKTKPVKSSNIEAVGYDKASNTMAVQFKGGQLYHLNPIPIKTYQSFIASESLGKYYNECFKANKELIITKQG